MSQLSFIRQEVNNIAFHREILEQIITYTLSFASIKNN